MNLKKYLKDKLLKINDLSIKTTLIMSFSFILGLMIILSIITFNNYRKDKEASTVTVIRQMNEQTVEKFDDYVSDISNISKFPLDEKNESGTLLNEYTNFNTTNLITETMEQFMDQFWYRFIYYKKHINSIFLFNNSGKSLYRMRNSSLLEIYNPKNEEWFNKAIQLYGGMVNIGTFQLPNIADLYDRPIYVFSLARGIVNVSKSELIGVVLVNIDIDYLDELCNKMLIIPNQRLIVIDNNGKTIYDTNKSNIAKNADTYVQQLAQTCTNTTNKSSLYGEDVLINISTSEKTQWKFINIVPVKELNLNINKIKNNTIFITLLIAIISALIAIIISYLIVIPINKLSLLMKIVEKGHFDIKIQFESKNELGQLSRTFINMSTRINKLINEVYINKIKQKDLELQMLQNQINPHFIYNTLESINMMAEINEQTEISQMTQSFGKFLRYGISRNDELVPLYVEINHLNEYISLQQVRFKNLFSVNISIDNLTLQCYTIKLLFQPIIENAIYHGMLEIETHGLIEITGFSKFDTLIFEITDNGVGMPSDKVLELNGYLNDFNNSFNSIGLKNVNKRIKLHYGDNYGVVVNSEVGQGTTVKITIPKLLP